MNATENQRLRTALRDLVAVSTIPAAWVGREPPTIPAGLVEALVGSLRLDFAFVRLRDPSTGVVLDAARGDAWTDFADWLRDQDIWETTTFPDVGHAGEGYTGLALPVGPHGEGGLVAVASRRADFPTETDQLLVSVASNQAAMAFQHARLAEERRAELRKTQDELAHVTRVMTLGELAASIAHEINQPLTAIIADAAVSLNLLARPYPDLAMVRQVLTEIMADAHRAGDVINRLRQLATKGEPHRSLLDMNAVIGEVAALVDGEIQKHGATLRLTLGSHLPPVFSDRIQLQQVLLNLVMNGLEAMDAVTDRSRQLTIRSESRHGGIVRASVKDAGIGISIDNADRIFDAFFTTKSTGMGMGLSISRSIIEGHGGRLWATPNSKFGATLHFELPAAESAGGP